MDDYENPRVRRLRGMKKEEEVVSVLCPACGGTGDKQPHGVLGGSDEPCSVCKPTKNNRMWKDGFNAGLDTAAKECEAEMGELATHGSEWMVARDCAERIRKLGGEK